MQTSTVYPQNYVVNPPTVEQYSDAACAPSKRCVRLIVFLAIVTLLLVCAIVIPLALSKKCDKGTSETTTPITEKITTTTTAAAESTESTRAPAISDSTGTTTTTTTKSQRSMPTGVSSDSHTQSMISMDTSTNTNGWMTNDMMNTRVSNTDATEKTTATVSIDSHTTTQVTTAAATTTSSSMIRLNGVNDMIIGLDNTIAGGPIVGNYSITGSSQSPKQAMDGNPTTKYYNNQPKRNSSQTEGKGIGSGFIVVPSISNWTMARALRFFPASDIPGRDPMTVTLEGSNATNTNVLYSGSIWTLIYNGSTGIGARNSSTPPEYGAWQDLNNKIRFASYRLLVTSKRDLSLDAVQYAEAEIFGDI